MPPHVDCTWAPHRLTTSTHYTHTVCLACPRPGSRLRALQIRHGFSLGYCSRFPPPLPDLPRVEITAPSHRLHAFSHDLHPPPTLHTGPAPEHTQTAPCLPLGGMRAHASVRRVLFFLLLSSTALLGQLASAAAANTNAEDVPAFSTTLGFKCKEVEGGSGRAVGCAVGEAQLSLDIFDKGK